MLLRPARDRHPGRATHGAVRAALRSALGMGLASTMAFASACGIEPREPGAARASNTAPSATAPIVAPEAVATEIAWVAYDDAFATAEREHKPVVLFFTAGWCGHCNTYRDRVLTDATVIQMSTRFVMVRIDIDERRDLNMRYGSDGGYVPRTMFFTPEGAHRPELRAARTQSVYFLNTGDPGELLGLMQRAIGS